MRSFYELFFQTKKAAWFLSDPRDPDRARIWEGTFKQRKPLRSLKDVGRLPRYKPKAYMAKLENENISGPAKVRKLIADSTIPVQEKGPEVAINWAETGYLVVRADAVDIMQKLDPRALERFPVRVATAKHPYEVVSLLRDVECIDADKCDEADPWTDESQPEKMGGFKFIMGLRIEAKRVPPDAHIFYTRGWVSVIVSEELKEALEEAKITGVTYTPV